MSIPGMDEWAITDMVTRVIRATNVLPGTARHWVVRFRGDEKRAIVACLKAPYVSDAEKVNAVTPWKDDDELAEEEERVKKTQPLETDEDENLARNMQEAAWFGNEDDNSPADTKQSRLDELDGDSRYLYNVHSDNYTILKTLDDAIVPNQTASGTSKNATTAPAPKLIDIDDDAPSITKVVPQPTRSTTSVLRANAPSFQPRKMTIEEPYRITEASPTQPSASAGSPAIGKGSLVLANTSFGGDGGVKIGVFEYGHPILTWRAGIDQDADTVIRDINTCLTPLNRKATVKLIDYSESEEEDKENDSDDGSDNFNDGWSDTYKQHEESQSSGHPSGSYSLNQLKAETTKVTTEYGIQSVSRHQGPSLAKPNLVGASEDNAVSHAIPVDEFLNEFYADWRTELTQGVTRGDQPDQNAITIAFLRKHYEDLGQVPGVWYPKDPSQGLHPTILMHSHCEPRVPQKPGVHGAILYMSLDSEWRVFGIDLPLLVEARESEYAYYGNYVATNATTLSVSEGLRLDKDVLQYLAWRVWAYRTWDGDYYRALVKYFNLGPNPDDAARPGAKVDTETSQAVVDLTQAKIFDAFMRDTTGKPLGLRLQWVELKFHWYDKEYASHIYSHFQGHRIRGLEGRA